MPRPTPADLGLVLLAAAVLTGAVRVATQDPSPPTTPVAATAGPTATPTPTVTPTAAATPTPAGTTTPRATSGTVLMVGIDLAALEQPLADLGWEVLVGDPGPDGVLADEALELGTPAVVVLEVEPGTRTSDRVADAIERTRAALPDAVIMLVGPFDPAASRTSAAVEQAAVEHGVLFLDPIERAWTEGADPSLIAGDLGDELTAALAAAG